MKDCRDCQKSIKAYSQWLCRLTDTVRPTSAVRDSRSECGPTAKRFVPRESIVTTEGRDAGVGE